MESTSSPTLFSLSSSIVLIWPNKWENKRREGKCSKAAYGDNCAAAATAMSAAAKARKEERKERITRAEYLSSTETTLC